jgi:isopenicillin N synthase-like dioxygenase
MAAFAEMLGLPKATFADLMVGGDMGTIRLLQYPPVEREE